MRTSLVRFKIGHGMIAVGVAALVLTPFAWTPPGSRLRLFTAAVTAGTMLIVMSSGFLVDFIGRGQPGLKPRARVTKPQRSLLPHFLTQPPPHKRGKAGP